MIATAKQLIDENGLRIVGLEMFSIIPFLWMNRKGVWVAGVRDVMYRCLAHNQTFFSKNGIIVSARYSGLFLSAPTEAIVLRNIAL